LFVLLYFFFLAIVLYVLLRYTDYDYPFGIFKLFLLDRMYYMSVNSDECVRPVDQVNCVFHSSDGTRRYNFRC